MIKFYSTNNPKNIVSLSEAVFQGLAPDNGLYMPSEIKSLPTKVLQSLEQLSMQDIAFEMSQLFLEGYIKKSELEILIADAINFKTPLEEISDSQFVLELFHGPTCAFKDVGARFMSRLMKHFLNQQTKELVVLVATSGDTGSAVANGFYNVEGVKVVVLYPSKKVSHIQEQQLTTLGKNITALEVKGNFDDCQRMVKEAFLDNDVQRHINTTSANSINIARLIPQTFYFAFATAQLLKNKQPIIFSVPSGNYGNLTAGLFAKKAGAPIRQFIAASNANDVVPKYLSTGIYSPKPSISTISNAMDVGSPNNFVRMKEMFNNNLEAMQAQIFGAAFDDEQTKEKMKKEFDQSKYILDPHCAVACLGIEAYKKQYSLNAQFVALGTAHPAKFGDVISNCLNIEPKLPEQLNHCLTQEKKSILISNNFVGLKNYLLSK